MATTRILCTASTLVLLLVACGADPGGGGAGDVALDVPAWDSTATPDLAAAELPGDGTPSELPVDGPADLLADPSDPSDSPELPTDTGPDPGPDTLPDTSSDAPSPCLPSPCPEGAACTLVDGAALCTLTGVVVEGFEDGDMAAAATTAAWGGGVLTASLEGFGGDGSDGVFHATQNTLVNTAASGGVFQYTSFVIDEGVEVKVTGPNPWVVRVQQDAEIHGWIRADAQHGAHAASVPSGPPAPPGGLSLGGGLGGPGGGSGGDSGAGYGIPGAPGEGPGGGGGGGAGAFPFGAGAGGGGFGGPGGAGVGEVASPGAGGTPYGTPELVSLEGGSGGGGGGGRDVGGNDGSCGGCDGNCWQGVCQGGFEALGDGLFNPWDRPGGSGGGGGGGVGIYAAGDVTVSGRISADGGNGGWGDWSGPGGGGSGGAIRLAALGEVFLDGGTLSARGGRGGLVTNSNQKEYLVSGDGGDGIVRIESVGGLQAYLLDP
ncbi:MAG: hypothetical protein FJ098_17365, partial [Deltaproteobacteria bacterium]|nr:hypothetical protein [Deltaproteobacteria bacterium]